MGPGRPARTGAARARAADHRELRPPDYRPQLRAYFEEAKQGGGQTPHVLEKALSWHARYKREGSMLVK
jgi:acyl-CoA hydrolase